MVSERTKSSSSATSTASRTVRELKPWRRKGWVIPRSTTAVSSLIWRGCWTSTSDRSIPCVPWSAWTNLPRIAETRVPIPGLPGRVARHVRIRRCGVCTVFASEPLAGKRMVRITERRTKRDWAHFLEEIADQYESAEKITLVMDNGTTHVPGSLYEAFAPDKVKALWDRFGFVYTPFHGSLRIEPGRLRRRVEPAKGPVWSRRDRGFGAGEHPRTRSIPS